MRFEYEETFLAEMLRELAAARGELPRWLSLVASREDDGLDLADAQLDAGQAMGLIDDVDTALEQALEPLSGVLEVEPQVVQVRDERATMPTLHALDGRLTLALAPASLDDVASLARRLAERMASQPALQVVTVPAGLGGTGGCAAGDCLPEDAAAGPLFERLR